MQSDYFQNQLTQEEKDRAKVLEAILRLDVLRDAYETKVQLSKKIEDLLEAMPSRTSDGRIPTSVEYDYLVESLAEVTNQDKEDLEISFEFDGKKVDSFEELVELEKASGDKDSSIKFIHDGKVVDSFEELYALEKEERSSEVNELLAEVAKYEGIIVENEDYFESEFEMMDDELGQLFKKMND